MIDVLVEVGSKRAFASALDWPGWARSGRDEAGALAALLDYADRFRPVAERAGLRLPAALEVTVRERVAGDATTDFGAPSGVGQADREPLTAAAAARRLALVQAAWATLDDVAATAPAVLRKGPRGGGRDRDAIVEHVRGAEKAYAGKLGIRPAKVGDLRAALVDVLGGPSDGGVLRENGWTVRYAARRIAWHALDHAWEIEDRSQPRVDVPT